MYIAIKYTVARWSLYTCCLIVKKHEIVNWKQKLDEIYVSLDSKLLRIRTEIYEKRKEKNGSCRWLSFSLLVNLEREIDTIWNEFRDTYIFFNKSTRNKCYIISL